MLSCHWVRGGACCLCVPQGHGKLRHCFRLSLVFSASVELTEILRTILLGCVFVGCLFTVWQTAAARSTFPSRRMLQRSRRCCCAGSAALPCLATPCHALPRLATPCHPLPFVSHLVSSCLILPYFASSCLILSCLVLCQVHQPAAVRVDGLDVRQPPPLLRHVRGAAAERQDGRGVPLLHPARHLQALVSTLCGGHWREAVNGSGDEEIMPLVNSTAVILYAYEVFIVLQPLV